MGSLVPIPFRPKDHTPLASICRSRASTNTRASEIAPVCFVLSITCKQVGFRQRIAFCEWDPCLYPASDTQTVPPPFENCATKETPITIVLCICYRVPRPYGANIYRIGSGPFPKATCTPPESIPFNPEGDPARTPGSRTILHAISNAKGTLTGTPVSRRF